jgi:DNA-binding response OmpR family regulator
MRLLIVEDHADIAQSVADYFEALGHEVSCCADGADALSKALARDYDVIVLDRMLPGIDGTTFCRRLRDQRSTPVLMLTALDTLDDKIEGFDAGADDYLAKPFALAELRVRAEALHRRVTSSPAPAMLQVADLVYDLQTLQVSRAGTPVALNPTTRKLLEKLMREAPRVVSREALEFCVWGDQPPTEDVLRVHMHALRTSIDKPFRRKLLLTIHGVGYRLGSDVG